MDPVIIHYDGTCLTDPKCPHFLGGESPGGTSRACKYHFLIRAKVLMKFQPWQRRLFLDLTQSCPRMINEHNLINEQVLLSFYIEFRSSAKHHMVSQPPSFPGSFFLSRTLYWNWLHWIVWKLELWCSLLLLLFVIKIFINRDINGGRKWGSFWKILHHVNHHHPYPSLWHTHPQGKKGRNNK